MGTSSIVLDFLNIWDDLKRYHQDSVIIKEGKHTHQCNGWKRKSLRMSPVPHQLVKETFSPIKENVLKQTVGDLTCANVVENKNLESKDTKLEKITFNDLLKIVETETSNRTLPGIDELKSNLSQVKRKYSLSRKKVSASPAYGTSIQEEDSAIVSVPEILTKEKTKVKLNKIVSDQNAADSHEDYPVHTHGIPVEVSDPRSPKSNDECTMDDNTSVIKYECLAEDLRIHDRISDVVVEDVTGSEFSFSDYLEENQNFVLQPTVNMKLEDDDWESRYNPSGVRSVSECDSGEENVKPEEDDEGLSVNILSKHTFKVKTNELRTPEEISGRVKIIELKDRCLTSTSELYDKNCLELTPPLGEVIESLDSDSNEQGIAVCRESMDEDNQNSYRDDNLELSDQLLDELPMPTSTSLCGEIDINNNILLYSPDNNTSKIIDVSDDNSENYDNFVISSPIKHPLEHAWTFWYFKPDKHKSWEESQIEIMTVNTIEDFWAVQNWIEKPSGLTSGTDYSLFKTGILPDWEDLSNMHGGRWVAHCGRDVDHDWTELIMSMVGQQFGSEQDQQITGAVVSVRNKGNKLALWTRDHSSISVGLKMSLVLGRPGQFRVHRKRLKSS